MLVTSNLTRMSIRKTSLILSFMCIVLNCGCNLFPKNFPANVYQDSMLLFVSHASLNDFAREICVNNVTMEPEAYMTTVEIIQNRGYPAETHAVQTEDGYILELHRIPYGLSGPSANRPPVFLQHGLESQSGDWIVNFGNQSLGYMFADVGYDVWLGNYRGNTFSRKHVSLDPDIDAKEFWNFSFQEHGNYDLTASIDYVLNQTGFQQLTYVGHSMGTTAFFLLMANRTDYNAKALTTRTSVNRTNSIGRDLLILNPSITRISDEIRKPIKTMIGLAPGAAYFNTSSHETNLSPHINQVETVLNALGYYEVLPHSDFSMFLASTLCSAPDPVTCANVLQNIGGIVPDPDQLNTTRLPVYVAHSSAGSSAKNFYHYVQLMNDAQVFRAYNYGTIKNMEIYGQDPPPSYDLGKVTAPVALFSGKNDKSAMVEDVALLAQSLPNVVLNYQIENDFWHHLDFIWAIEAEYYQNTRIIDFVISRE